MVNPFSAEDIRIMRLSLKMSQKEFGKALGGITLFTVNRWENGKTQPKGLSLIELARLYKRSGKFKTGVHIPDEALVGI